MVWFYAGACGHYLLAHWSFCNLSNFLIGSLRTISYYSFITRVLSTIMYLTLFCVFIKTLALASDSIASYAVIIENKLTVSCIVGYNSESLKKYKNEK